jgi:hypothetical protein
MHVRGIDGIDAGASMVIYKEKLDMQGKANAYNDGVG